MFSTTSSNRLTNKNKTKSEGYTKTDDNYSSPIQIDSMTGYYKKEDIKDIGIIKRTLDILSDQIKAPMNEEKIKSDVKHFLQNHVDYDLNYSVNKNIDSDYYTVKLRSDDLSFSELFDLASDLNRKAVIKDHDFIIIAGV